jgi:23S rRNA (cytidine1920-2'-O)/16S rRNA (cytidine1409-2'-O)-methyltransferase
MALSITQKRKERIDTLLVSRGLIESRQRAQAALLAGQVRVGGRVVTRAGEMVGQNASIEITRRPRFVSRGGEKLAHALSAFAIDTSGWTCIDAGASTGGFTDCLLQHGALRVYAIDVGYGALDYSLRMDDRVVVMERTNVRDLVVLPEPCDLAVIDVSFIGLEKVIPALVKSLKPRAEIVALLKPQFQGRRQDVSRAGVVKDPMVHASIIGRFVAWVVGQRLRLLGLTTSPLLGPAGNKEFFLHLRTPGELS